jgi:hypothetical protein
MGDTAETDGGPEGAPTFSPEAGADPNAERGRDNEETEETADADEPLLSFAISTVHYTGQSRSWREAPGTFTGLCK